MQHILTDSTTITITEEKPHINPNLEYFAVTRSEFLIYDRKKKQWHCLLTKLVIPGNISDVID